VEATLEIPRVAAVDAAVDPARAAGVRFGRESARVGERTRVSVHASSTANETTSTYESDFATEVLAVEGPAPSRVRIHFDKNTTFDNITTTPTVLDGKTYIVDVKLPFVTWEQTGVRATDEEVTRVLDVLPDLGTRSQIDQVLPDGEMQVGEHRDGIATAIARILHPRVWTVNEGTAVLGAATPIAVMFDVHLVATSSVSGMKFDVKGKAQVRLSDARLLGFNLSGTFQRPDGEHGQFDIQRIVKLD
jgi:hypothetical protein